MKITKSQLKRIIKEELFRLMEDFDDPTMTGRWTDKGPVYNCDALKAEIDEAAEDVAGRPAVEDKDMRWAGMRNLNGNIKRNVERGDNSENHQDET